MMVETELRPSPIHGTGVFLLEPVKRGGVVWRFDSRIDRVYADWELEGLPEGLRHFLSVYSTYHEESGLWVLCGDNGRHFNHSDEPNTQSMGIGFGDDIAAEDLPVGAELTTDYRTICDAVRARGSI
jgi:SET domain-containing protein